MIVKIQYTRIELVSIPDDPQSELYVSAGDYILVWGECDEDGFYEGELLDGRKG